MVAIVPRGNPGASRLEVDEKSLDYWSSVGYVPAEGEKVAKKTAKKAAAKKSSSSKSK